MDTAVEWLLGSDEPAVRGIARRDFLGESFGEDVLRGAKVEALLAAPPERRSYQKWKGTHWRIVSLVELEVPAGEPRAVAAAEQVLTDLMASLRYKVPVIEGRARRCGSIEGNALAACSRLGLIKDERAGDALDELESQRKPDGRWHTRLQWWRPAGGSRAQEVVDWGRTGPSEMVTLNALRTLTAAGR